MSDDKAHIRDFLLMTPEDLKEGRVTGKTMCGLDDPNHNKLTFANAESVANRSIRNYCEKCRNKWIAEYTGSAHRKARQKFRNVIQSLFNGRKLKSNPAPKIIH